MKRITPLLALAAYVILAGALVAGIWRVGDAQCAALVHDVSVYGDLIARYAPCEEEYTGWLEPALR